MKCIACAHVDIDKYPRHAAAGMGRCTLQRLSGVFESLMKERECGRFQDAAQEVMEQRREWWLSITRKNDDKQ